MQTVYSKTKKRKPSFSLIQVTALDETCYLYYPYNRFNHSRNKIAR